MSDQPEALRLAEELGVSFQHDFHVVCEEAAAELRRLYKEIAALREERRRDMAEIYSLREAEESLREENERLREALKRHGMHNADCFLRGECNCGLDAALRDETAIWSARHDPRE